VPPIPTMSAGRSAPNFDGLSPARRPLAAFFTRLMAASLIAICAWYPRRAPETPTDPDPLRNAFESARKEAICRQSHHPEGEQVLRGREGLAQLSPMLRDTWTQFRFEPERFIDAGQRVVVFYPRHRLGWSERRGDRA
jgi:hypothetical protein